MNNEEEQTPENGQEQSPPQTEAVQSPGTVDALNFEAIPAIAKKVITDPAGFYQGMPRSGGLVEPLVFMVIMALVSAVLTFVLTMVGLGSVGAMATGLIVFILVPIFVVIFGFVGAAIAYVIWRMMGSQENFETAFRCVAYTAATAPITAVLSLVPYLGSIVSGFWPLALLAIASIHVHRRSVQTSWVVFGAIGVVLVLISVSGEQASRELMRGMEGLEEILNQQDQ